MQNLKNLEVGVLNCKCGPKWASIILFNIEQILTL